jgi:oxygen-independent coproporphyrinogen-3 oxidase
VPFCKRKCPYCDFKSIEAPRAPEDRFAGCLSRELEKITAEEGLRKALLSTLYLGGGTPSILSPDTVARILNSIISFFRPAEDLEVTLEVNPDTVDSEKLAAFRSCGVTRLSIGFQALDDRHLVLLGRAHTAEAALKAFSLAREAGFTNVGVDLMFAIPGQTLADWEATLRRVSALRPEHISLYGLTVEEGTPFHGRYGKGREGLPTDEIEARMYLAARETLTKAGYSHYEVSNFACPGFESRHNKDWNGADYAGAGPALFYLSARSGKALVEYQRAVRVHGESGKGKPIEAQEAYPDGCHARGRDARFEDGGGGAQGRPVHSEVRTFPGRGLHRLGRAHIRPSRGQEGAGPGIDGKRAPFPQ